MRAGFPEQSPGAAGLHAEWYAANVEQGTLTAQRCECGVYRLPARYRCAACASDRWAFVPVGPDAVVETFTVTRRPIHFAFAEVVPYASVVARTPEGVRLLLQHRGDAVHRNASSSSPMKPVAPIFTRYRDSGVWSISNAR